MDEDYIEPIDQDRLLQLVLYNNGGPYYNVISPYNRAIRTELGRVITERGNVIRHRKNISLSLSFSDYKFVKPMLHGNIPMTPIMAQHSKKTYSGMIRATLNIKIHNKTTVVHHDKLEIDLVDIPVPILSNGCNLSTNNADTPDDPIGHIKAVITAIKNHPEDLVNLDLGIYILDGNFYAMKFAKDMNTNTLFLNVQ